MKKIFGLILLCLLLTSPALACSSPKVDFQNGIYHITLNGKAYAKKIKFISSEKLISNKDVHKQTKSTLTMNTGFFDPTNQKTISYIIEENNVISEDPLFNENLMSNTTLRRNLDKILNRTEFRIVECDNKYHYEIAPHNAPVDFGCNIATSAQGGPMLLPNLRLEEEFFIVRNPQGRVIRESASVMHKCARTLIGLKDGNIHLVIITNDNPMTIYEAREYCKTLGLEYAMAFDGGSSTSLNYKNTINVVSTKDVAGRLLKSFMVVK